MRAIISALALVSSVAFAAEPGGGWRFVRDVDKMTDKVACNIVAPPSRKLLFFFRNYVVIFRPQESMPFLSGGTLMVRVDKNPHIEMRLLGGPSVATVDYNAYVEDWVAQLLKGSVLLVRVSNSSGIVEDEFAAGNFPAAFAEYQACLKSMP